MLAITVRDLQARWKQFAIAVVGAGLVFALTLILTGMSAGFVSEAHATIDSIGADAWIVPAGISGPFAQASVIDPGAAAGVRGAQEVSPLAIAPATVRKGGDPVMVNLVGHVPGHLGAPPAAEGRAPVRPGEVMVDRRLGLSVGDRARFGTASLTVVGVVSGKTYFAGVPIAYVLIGDAQRIAYAGRDLATALVTRGRPASVPPGLQVLDEDAVYRDLTRPTASARKTIATTRAFMWFVGVVIIGAVTYLSALDRIRDFAVLKAVGAGSGSLLASIGLQAVLASLFSAVLAMGLAQVLLLLPTFTLPITITGGAYLALPFVAVVVGVLASVAAIRRAVQVDPALAFG